MDITREFYWNVAHISVVLMYIFAFLTVGIVVYGFVRRIRVYRQGRKLQRLDKLTRRVVRLVKRAFVQLRVMLVRAPGIVHAFQFWAILLLFLGTVLVLVQVDFLVPLWNIAFLKGLFYQIFSVTLDLAGLTVFLMLCFFIVRRYLFRPKGLETTWQDHLILSLLTVILLTGFIIEGARMAVTEMNRPEMTILSPVGFLVASLMSGWSEATLRTIHAVTWWTHFSVVMTTLALAPFTKFRHLLLTPTNYLFADLREKGSIETPNLEAADAVSFGAATVSSLTWKDIFDGDACTSCKRCQDRCPAWNTSKPLSPMKVVQQIGEVAFKNPQASLIDTISKDALWACTTCYACQEICPADIEHVNKIIEMRRHMVLMEGEFPGSEVMTATSNTEVNFNPFGLAFASRGDWAEGLEVVHPGNGDQADVLYFAGCYASFDKRNQAVARNFIKICNAAGVKVGILGKDEKCCGEPMRKLGNEYLYQMMAAENIQRFKGSGVRKIVTTCPHCFNTLSRDYRDLGLEAEVEVEHYTVFLAGLLKEGRLKMKAQPLELTYHDSCYLGRYKGILDEPRDVLRTAGGSIKEMAKSRMEGFCCGGGGGRVLAEENLGERINVARVKMAQESGAPVLVSNCPFCLTMFEDGIKTGGMEGMLQARDLAEIIVERISN